MQVTDEMVRVAAEAVIVKAAEYDGKPPSFDAVDVARLHETMRHALTAALAAMQDHVIVPREPTAPMVQAAYRRDDDEPSNSWGKTQSAPFEEIYRAMIAAAPSQLSKRDDAAKTAEG